MLSLFPGSTAPPYDYFNYIAPNEVGLVPPCTRPRSCDALGSLLLRALQFYEGGRINSSGSLYNMCSRIYTSGVSAYILLWFYWERFGYHLAWVGAVKVM